MKTRTDALGSAKNESGSVKGEIETRCPPGQSVGNTIPLPHTIPLPRHYPLGTGNFNLPPFPPSGFTSPQFTLPHPPGFSPPQFTVPQPSPLLPSFSTPRPILPTQTPSFLRSVQPPIRKPNKWVKLKYKNKCSSSGVNAKMV
jgi:hypothetical protein